MGGKNYNFEKEIKKQIEGSISLKEKIKIHGEIFL